MGLLRGNPDVQRRKLVGALLGQGGGEATARF